VIHLIVGVISGPRCLLTVIHAIVLRAFVADARRAEFSRRVHVLLLASSEDLPRTTFSVKFGYGVLSLREIVKTDEAVSVLRRIYSFPQKNCEPLSCLRPLVRCRSENRKTVEQQKRKRDENKDSLRNDAAGRGCGLERSG
jgi:hypothetical protein